ncbi:prolyl oligopeptidase family serine peptidase [Labilibaculum sp.]|uniref:prolyl oligopeptidase family serine peptidase n=1 Tax=Labilibaculum sp. TaxID=2060723 RepID=UPI003569EFE6
MKRNLLLFTGLFFLFHANAQSLEYPTCPQHTLVDTFFSNYPLSDPYRNLENVRDETTLAWIEAENKLSKKYLHKASSQYSCKSSIDKYAYITGSHPVKKGKYYFSYKRRNDLAVPGLYLGTDPKNIDYPIVDPNYKKGGDKIDIMGYSVSKDSKNLAYAINRNGSDWREVYVVGLPSGTKQKDHLKGVKFSSMQWKNDGFFYSRYPDHGEFYATEGEEIFYHKLGDEQEKDQLIFKRKNPSIQFSYQTTSNERYFILREETSRYFNYFFIDYQAEKPYLRPLLMKQKSGLSIIDSQDGKLIAITGKDSNGGSVVFIDPYDPYNWKQIVPESGNGVLTDCIPKMDRLLLIYQSNQHPILKIFKYSGEEIYNLELPEASSIYGFYGEKEDVDLYFYLQQYTIPSIPYIFNTNTFKRELGERVNVTFSFQNYENVSISYPINDSVSIPMNLVYKKGLKLDGQNPCLLKTYGGFGSIASPNFDPGIVYFIEKGGVYAYANIRGGGDRGKAWMRAGRRLNKQNSIDDFNAAADYLIKKGYTCADKLAATGASHGGLIVAAAAIQHPELYKAVVPVVAPTDMIRFEQFTVGSLHMDEFGTVADSLDFVNLRSYSPLHNIKKEVNYPAMLVMTSENDDRVPPFHSYKFVAALQNRKAQSKPILLRVEEQAGHYGAINHSAAIKEKADMYGFIMKMLMN